MVTDIILREDGIEYESCWLESVEVSIERRRNEAEARPDWPAGRTTGSRKIGIFLGRGI